MASVSASAPTRTVFLLHGEDPFRTRLRLAELVRELLAGGPGTAGDLATVERPELGAALGVTRHDAREDRATTIALSGQAQGLFAPADEKTVVVVENADALAKDDQHVALLGAFPREAALVLVTLEKIETRTRRPPSGGRAASAAAPAKSLPEAVEEAGGRVERIERLGPDAVPAWIRARAALHKADLAPEAAAALAEVGPDTERLENEIQKLAVFAGGARIEAEDVRRLVSGAIESDVFKLTSAVVRRDLRLSLGSLDALLADGQAVLQILALLLWQMRVLLFAAALERSDPKHPAPKVEEMAKAIRSTPGAILRWRAEARRVGQRDIVRAFEALYATDVAIKSGRVSSEETALVLCVLDLCGVRSAGVAELVAAIPVERRR